MTNDAGDVVDPKDVLNATVPSDHVFVIVDCPDPSYIDSVVNGELGTIGHPSIHAARVFHYGPYEVVTDTRYLAAMARMLLAEHIFFCAEFGDGKPVLRTATTVQTCFHAIHPRLFPLPLQGRPPVDPVVPLNGKAGKVGDVWHPFTPPGGKVSDQFNQVQSFLVRDEPTLDAALYCMAKLPAVRQVRQLRYPGTFTRILLRWATLHAPLATHYFGAHAYRL